MVTGSGAGDAVVMSKLAHTYAGGGVNTPCARLAKTAMTAQTAKMLVNCFIAFDVVRLKCFGGWG